MADNKDLIKERLNELSNREEGITITRALFDDLVTVITGMSPEETANLDDRTKENILLNFTEKRL